MIECMFESMSPDGLLGEVEACARWESMLIARRLTAIAALLSHRVDDALEGESDPGYALISGHARASAEVAAAMNLPPREAGDMVDQAEALSRRLPRVGALLADGRTDWATVQLIITRTDLVGTAVMARLDAALAARISGWQCWSRRRILHAVDATVRALDPDAAKERRLRADRARAVRVTALPDGMARLRGALPAPGAAVLDTRLTAMATAVCARDSRTLAQRRADALVALSQGGALACDCGQPGCPCAQPGEPAAPTARLVINVIATAQTVAGDSAQPGYLDGYGVIDAEQVRDLAESATLRLVQCPTTAAGAALRYQPSAAMERWIRSRDLTCRFPGCDRPASSADIDHTIPFNHGAPRAGGPTCAVNLACCCRHHHRLKTFHGGLGGWRDQQLADGTLVWTSPTGRTYRTTPDGPELFPQLRQPCVAPPARKRHRSRDKTRQRALARRQLREQRPRNAEQLRINRARRQEIADRQWRNNMRRMLLVLKGGPSTSAWCTWVNDPLEPEELPADWQPPPPPATTDTDEPPF
jgi:Domain of unknown function (DUF222)